jgi:hypothetical protein
LLKIDALSANGEFYYLSRQLKINLLPWLLQDAWILKVHILEVEGSFYGPNKSWIARTLCNAKGLCPSNLQYNKIIHGWLKDYLAVIL